MNTIMQKNLLFGQQLFMERETVVFNCKNYKNLKYYSEIKTQYT